MSTPNERARLGQALDIASFNVSIGVWSNDSAVSFINQVNDDNFDREDLLDWWMKVEARKREENKVVDKVFGSN